MSDCSNSSAPQSRYKAPPTGKKKGLKGKQRWDHSLESQPANSCSATWEVLLKGLSFFSQKDAWSSSFYKNKEDSDTFSFDWAVFVVVNSGKCLLGLSWVLWVHHHWLFQFKKLSRDCRETKRLLGAQPLAPGCSNLSTVPTVLSNPLVPAAASSLGNGS